MDEENPRFFQEAPSTFRISEKFSAALAPEQALNAMTSLEEVKALLRTAKIHLVPKGILVFDVAMAGPDRWPGRFSPHFHERGTLRRGRFHPFFADEIDQAITEVGFDPLERWSGFDGTPFDEKSAFQVLVSVPSDSTMPKASSNKSII